MSSKYIFHLNVFNFILFVRSVDMMRYIMFLPPCLFCYVCLFSKNNFTRLYGVCVDIILYYRITESEIWSIQTTAADIVQKRLQLNG